MNELERYQKVNSAESLTELSEVIRSFADEDGYIYGRSRKFKAEPMAEACMHFGDCQPNILTRNWGIRQQALYLQYYYKF